MYREPTTPELVREIEADTDAALVLLGFVRGHIDNPVLLDALDLAMARIGEDVIEHARRIRDKERA